ncbi:hypothetical protein CYQ88_07835 [Hydrogenovibrio sp. SC-1]|nr:hypothetical protein CYQ88_07835 [Hydrogenovibrio sp. SC-1]
MAAGVSFFSATSVWAHGDMLTERYQIWGAASLTGYSNSVVAKNEYWRIPGLLMGGEALPISSGVQLDDAYLGGFTRLSDQASVSAKLGIHGGGDGHAATPALMQLQYAYQLPQYDLTLDAGLLEAQFSPIATHHASFALFSEAALMADAFWGRGYHDKGARLKWQPSSHWKFGLEYWNGEAFPATSGEKGGARDVFVQYQVTLQDWWLHAGSYVHQSKAFQRGDARYTTGHTHGTVFSPLPDDVRFSGDSDLIGLSLGMRTPSFSGMRVKVDYEVASLKAKGSVFDSTRSMDYEANHLGHYLTSSVEYDQHQLSYRYERISLENTLTGTSATILGDSANLVSSDSPIRQTIQWHWQVSDGFAWRVAMTQDQSLPEKSQRYSVGLVWKETFLSGR